MKSICALVVVTISFPLLALAQNPKATPKSSELTRTPEAVQVQDDVKRAEAISLVEKTAAEAPSWDDKKTAVIVLADSADLLWDQTPGQGTKWLASAWELVDQVPASPRNEKLKAFFTHSDQTWLRTVILSTARRHDSQLAEKLLKQLAQNEPAEKKEGGAFDDRSARSEQLLNLAQEAVDSNPYLACTLAERSLGDGLSYNLQNVLTSLRTKNVELANGLFDLALARFRSVPSDPSEAEVLAGYLFQSGFTFSTSAGQTILVVNPAQQNLPPVASSEPQRAKNFLLALYEVLLSRPIVLDTPESTQRAQQMLALGSRMAGRYDTFAPELVPPMQGFLAQLRRQLSLNDSPSSFTETNRSASTRKTTKGLTDEEIYEKHLSELEEKADNGRDPIARKLAYVEAAAATAPKDYPRALCIVEKIDGDDDLRADARAFFLYRASLFFLGRGEVDRAADLEPQIHDFSRRSVVRIAIAQQLISAANNSERKQIDRQRAFELLNQIGLSLPREQPSAKIAKIGLARAAILAKLDQAQALAALEETMQIINHLDSFDLHDQAAPSLGLGESISGATVATPKVGFNFRSAIEPLLATNFADISVAVETFRVKELRGLARLEVAKLFLNQKGRSNKQSNLSLVRPPN